MDGKQGNIYLEGDWDRGRGLQGSDGKKEGQETEEVIYKSCDHCCSELPACHSWVDHYNLNKVNKPDLTIPP